MGLLKKIKASTLMETLVATVLIVIIFIMASLVLNNVFSTAINNDTNHLEARITEIEYLVTQKQINIPYTEEFEKWTVTVRQGNRYFLNIEAYDSMKSKLVIQKQLVYEN